MENRHKPEIVYPYLPEGREILYVPEDHEHMQAAKKAAETKSLDKQFPTGAVVVKDNIVIGEGANGSLIHEQIGCERKRLNIPTGQGYELCEGCHPDNHAEPKAIRDALEKKLLDTDVDLYLWGHWWCCEGCWKWMDEHGIRNVYLVENAQERFTKKV